MRLSCRSAVLAALVSVACSFSAAAQTSSPGSGSIFNNPKIGVNVDWCLHFATECGKPAADRFCQLNGFAGSLTFAVEFMRPTFVLGDNRLCDQADCRGFTRVQCGTAGAGGIPTPANVSGSCGNPTVPNAYLTGMVPQPRGWDRPVGIPWRRGVTVNDCYRRCVENTSFPCRSFVLEEDAANGAQCLISNLDRSGGLTVSPSPPTPTSRKNYWELSACGPNIPAPGLPPITGGNPPARPTSPFDCQCPTIPDAHLTGMVPQPRGWQRPVAIPWQRGITANDCYRKCAENTSFPCRAFVLEEDPAYGAQCWISSLDRAGGITVTPYPTGARRGSYWEMDACRPGRECPAQPQAPSPVGYCQAPTVPNAYLTASVPQPRGWQRPIGIQWQHGVTANDCYRRCVENPTFKCLAFVLEEDRANGAQCWISSLDRAGGLNVSAYPPTATRKADYWEIAACQPGGASRTNQPPAPAPAPAPQPPRSGDVCTDPRTLGIMDEWLTRAVPPQQPGESLRYEPWGRLVGRSVTAEIRAPSPPDTPLTRCQWLWQYAGGMRSTNGLGTLRDYVLQRLQ